MVCGKKAHVSEKYSLEAFNAKNLSWNGGFKINSKEQFFQKTEFDLFLNYFTEASAELLILSASVKTNLKTGFPMVEKRLNNLEIAVDPKNHQLFTLELKKYLKIIK